MEVTATAKGVRISARKVRVVRDSVLGLPVAEALTVLKYIPRHGARELAAVIKSAAANAEHNYNLDGSQLRVHRIDIDNAGIIKRFIAKPRGQAGSVFKRMSHLRAVVSDEVPVESKRRASAVSMPKQLTRATMSGPAVAKKRRVKAEAPAAEAEAAALEAEAVATEGEETTAKPSTTKKSTGTKTSAKTESKKPEAKKTETKKADTKKSDTKDKKSTSKKEEK